MSFALFENREDAGRRLAERLKDVPLNDPLVLAIPRGGVEVGVPLASALGAELDVVLSRKLRAREQPELALGAVSETGEVHLNQHGRSAAGKGSPYLELERQHQMREIERRVERFRAVRPQAPVAGRSVIVTDDGIATGSTMIAALRTVRAGGPCEIIVALPVAPIGGLTEINGLCDRVVCLHQPEFFWSVGQCYRNFNQVSDQRVVDLLRMSSQRTPAPVKQATIRRGECNTHGNEPETATDG